MFTTSVNVKVVKYSESRAGVIEWRRGLICIFIEPCKLNKVRVYNYIQVILRHKELIFMGKTFKYGILIIKVLSDKISVCRTLKEEKE